MSESRSQHDEMQATRALGVGCATGGNTNASPLTNATQQTYSSAALPIVCKADITRDDLTGLSLGPYDLGEKLGGGGMGKIFAARHRHLGKEFAIKFIASVAANLPEAQARFDQEVKALGKLQHANIVSAVDAGCVDGMQYLATERIYGEDLSQIVARRGATSVADACELVRQAAQGLAYSHANNIVHRDIKPSNLFLDRTGVVKILDFGLVRSTNNEQFLTIDGATLGTLDFISPEQAQDARTADPRSDLYSLGCTLMFLLTGHAPFSNERYSTAAAKIKGHLLDTPEWLNQPAATVPAPLVTALKKMLAKNPAERFASASELAAIVEPWCRGHRITQLLGPCVAESRTVSNSNLHAYDLQPQSRIVPVIAISGAFLLGVIAVSVSSGLATPSSTSAPGPATSINAEQTSQADRRTQNSTKPANTDQATAKSDPTNATADEGSKSSADKSTGTSTVVTRQAKETANAPVTSFNALPGSKKSDFTPITGDITKPD